MIKYAKLFLQLLRYRVAIMLILFFLLPIALHEQVTQFSLRYIFAIVALLSSYVAATSLNDIADKKIDKINHPGKDGRPLANGEATERDIYVLYAFAAVLTLGFAALIGAWAVAIMTASLFLNYAYSFPPLKISYRTYLAHFMLTFAYVVIPYLLAITTINANFSRIDLIFASSLVLLFFARIILKDFRDRKGDAKYGKPTFLLKYGKFATCIASFIALLAGNGLMFLSLNGNGIAILIILQVIFSTIYYSLFKLWKSSFEDEKVYIGVGAKMGNGLLITILAYLLLVEYNATLAFRIFFCTILAASFLVSFIMIAKNPEIAVFGYRG
jgi:4-hydroxybenzoate polyprenyltransferase